MAVLCASVKRAELLEPGDVINYGGTGSQVECVEVDETEGIVWVDFHNRQDTFATGHRVEYVTAEQWENA